MGSNIKASTLLLIFVTFTTVAAQTFQYSRGWTNGKRAHKRDEGVSGVAGSLDRILSPCQMTKLKYVLEGKTTSERSFQYSRGWTNGKRGHKRDEGVSGVAGSLERILSPCQMTKLKYVLEGKTTSERLLLPCDYSEEDEAPKRYKNERQDPLFDSFL